MGKKQTYIFSIVSVICVELFVFPAQAELPKAAMIDRYKIIVLEALKNEECQRAIDGISRLEQLTTNLPDSIAFFKGDCLLKKGQYSQAMNTLGVYISQAGLSGRYYQQALNAYTEAEVNDNREKIEQQTAENKRLQEEQERLNEEEIKRKQETAAVQKRRMAAIAVEINASMVSIPSGCFQMGSNASEIYQIYDEQQHKVCISRDFLMGKHEVTQGQWLAVMGSNPSHFKDCGDRCPVEKVSWNDVQRFIGKLNAATGQQFRLPTEAEWEYACRSGGKSQKYCGGNHLDEVGWNANNSSGKTHSVKQKQANGLGLYDMSGNVGEWVQDFYRDNYYKNSPENNPKGPATGSLRGNRGGSWLFYAKLCRSADRNGSKSSARNDFLGFRLARTL